MKNTENTPFANLGWDFAHPQGDRMGAKFFNVFAPLHPLFITLPNLYIYIYKGYAAARALHDRLNVGLVFRAGWAFSTNPRKSFTKTVTNHAFLVGHRAHPLGLSP